MTFRVTTAGKAEKLELPGDRTIRVWIVGAEVSRFDSRGQVVAERGMTSPILSIASFIRFVTAERARSGFGRRAPVPAAESDGSGVF